MRPMALALTAIAAGLACVSALAAAQKAAQPADAAFIVNTSSTNTTGYQTSVFANGVCDVEDAGTGKILAQVLSPQQAQDGHYHAVREAKIPAPMARKLFHDLTAAMPLTQLPATFRIKSVSFGTSIYITYKGQRTPDLSSPADPREQALKVDITAIAAALNLKNGPRRPMLPLPPSVPGH